MVENRSTSGSNREGKSGESASLILARLQTLEEEIRRLTDLAAQEENEKRRSQYWDLARDLQAETRAVRLLLAQMPSARNKGRGEPVVRRVLKALGLRMEAAARIAPSAWRYREE